MPTQFTLGSVNFDSLKGTIQNPKPVFEQFTRLGADVTYVQRLKTEAAISQVTATVVLTSFQACEDHRKSLDDSLGLPISGTLITYSTGGAVNYTYSNLYLLDYTYEIKSYAGGSYVLTYQMSIKSDGSAQTNSSVTG